MIKIYLTNIFFFIYYLFFNFTVTIQIYFILFYFIFYVPLAVGNLSTLGLLNRASPPYPSTMDLYLDTLSRRTLGKGSFIYFFSTPFVIIVLYKRPAVRMERRGGWVQARVYKILRVYVYFI